MHLYRKYGFIEVPVDKDKFKFVGVNVEQKTGSYLNMYYRSFYETPFCLLLKNMTLIILELYLLSPVIGNTNEFIMANTDKTAVGIEWKLDTPVREDIYQYIVNG